jgi:hypothetical protein
MLIGTHKRTTKDFVTATALPSFLILHAKVACSPSTGCRLDRGALADGRPLSLVQWPLAPDLGIKTPSVSGLMSPCHTTPNETMHLKTGDTSVQGARGPGRPVTTVGPQMVGDHQRGLAGQG